MENNELYKKFKLAVTGMTIEQIESLSWQQTTELLKTSEFSSTWLGNMKRCLLIERQVQADLQIKELVEQNLSVDLRNSFPEVQCEKVRVDGKLCVQIWPDGKPDNGAMI